MNYIILVKNDGYYYRTNKIEVDPKLSNVSNFLADEVGTGSYHTLFDLLKDPGMKGVDGNMINVTKGKNEMLMLEYGLDGLAEGPDPYPFVTTKENLMKIIDDWVAIKKDPRYNVIIIWRDGDKPWKDGDQIIFEGRLEEHPYKKYLKGEKVTKI